MVGGFSNSIGILIYDTSIPGKNGVFGYYDEQNQMVILVDNYKELRKLQLERETKNISKEKEKQKDKIVWLVMFLYLILTLIALWKGSFLFFLATLLFSILSYMPTIVFCFTFHSSYKNKDILNQYRRYHGCEHTILNVRFKKDVEWTIPYLQKASYLENECGTVHSGQFLFFNVVVFWLVLHSTTIGLMKMILFLCIWIIILFLNLLNPYNPFKLCQLYSVKKPMEKEYRLGIAIMEKFMQL